MMQLKNGTEERNKMRDIALGNVPDEGADDDE